ncbi:MAG: hypothetical protein CSA09_03780 [Candidatus Contendobacter odensis]|uniref:Anti sigma-E protein RseA N-terminal domain-containing protein n=1 Tax=Candidatus Contendibacter odensensis TaxID=1400860 RepID=A0A2G6PEP6_9GAMM|nr:MAG: hypothetical protein CSA09_03780 [Candidatus Contendobacter odensis]
MADKTSEQPLAPVDSKVNSAIGQLSAMVDGELGDHEVELALHRLCQDSDLQGCWERYQLISGVLQGHSPAVFDVDFAGRVRQLIEDEALPQHPQPLTRPLLAWHKPVTGFALAASVVMVSLFGLRLTQVDTDTDTVLTAPKIATTPAPASIFSRPTPQSMSARLPVEDHRRELELTRARLDSYLVNHNGYASKSNMNGMLPYVRMVGYQNNR